MFLDIIHLFFCCPALIFLSVSIQAQIPTPTPTPQTPATQEQQEPIRTLTEEVQLTVTALDSQGHLDHALAVEDILILEDAVPQEIRSARRTPASVVLLLDTGGDINTFKRLSITRAVARQFLSALSPRDRISVIQFNTRIEILQNWTTDASTVLPVIDSRLLSGKRARLLDGMLAAVEQFRDTPAGNRHLVMITDGVQSDGERVDRQEVIDRLLAANVAVHVLSYTTVSLPAAARNRKLNRDRDRSLVPDEAVDSLPVDHRWDPLRRLHDPGGMIVDLDPERRKRIKKYEAAMARAEVELAALSNETGGRTWIPESLAEMVENGAEVARLVDSQYVVSYKPKRSLATAQVGQIRKIDVASRRVGLQLIARRHYTVAGNPNLSGQSRPRRINF
jgi:VWFA-related protein